MIIINPNKTKVEEKSYKNILIYYNEYVRIKDFEIYKNYYCKSFIPYYPQSKWILWRNLNLILVPTNESKEIIKNMNNFGVKSEI